MGFGGVSGQRPDIDALYLKQTIETGQSQELKDEAEFRVIMAETNAETIQAAQMTQPPMRATVASTLAKRAENAKKVLRKEDTAEAKSQSHKVPRDKLGDLVKQFNQQNDELDPQKLEQILNDLDPNASEEDIRELVQKRYPDPFLANDVFDFLKQATVGGLREKIQRTHDAYKEEFQREIQIGRNITQEAKTFGDLDTPDKLREWYRTLTLSTTGQMKTADLFLKMNDRFGFEKLVKATHFYLRALGADLRNKGIPPAELSDKVAQVRSFQAIINVFRMSSMRMRVIPYALSYYSKQGFNAWLPKNFGYQQMGKCLMEIVQNRHLNKDMLLQIVRNHLK